MKYPTGQLGNKVVVRVGVGVTNPFWKDIKRRREQFFHYLEYILYACSAQKDNIYAVP